MSRAFYKTHRTLTSNNIRNSFIEYFCKNHGHKFIKSSSVVPLCDPTVPFVNAGMNQFKGVFLGVVEPPCARAVNSQKCVRVGGKHNDLELVGMDGHHHTFFEMLGNWSFGDYYKKEACQMAWDLLLGPFRLKPEDLLVTYFGGDVVIGLQEDRECRDIWRSLGVPASRLQARGAADNFWEMGATGPCGACTELHYVGTDGSLTEIWNLVFIDCNREGDGSVKRLRRQHVDTGMGLERIAALLQGVHSNYDTDLFRPLMDAIHRNSKGVPAYSGCYGADAALDQAYRRLADHARMVSVCLADDVFPVASLNLKQIMRKSFKICTDVFQNPQLLNQLYSEVASSLGDTYPELITKQNDANLIIDHERESYAKLRADLKKKWKGLVQKYPEVESLADIELAGFPLGYTDFKEKMSKINSATIPGEIVFKLYDTHGFPENVIERIAKLNNLDIDKKAFWKLLTEHKSKHKTAFKERAQKGLAFDDIIDRLLKSNIKRTDDTYKYNYLYENNEVRFEPLQCDLVAIVNEDGEWIDFLDPCETSPYYLVTDRTNFFCEEGGQEADTGVIRISDDVYMKVEKVFKVRDFVFHKGHFVVNRSGGRCYVRCGAGAGARAEVCGARRLRLMQHHTATHLLHAALRRLLPRTALCQTGAAVSPAGLALTLTLYGDKLTQEVLLHAEELVRSAIRSDAPVRTRVVDSVRLAQEGGALRVPGEAYPERGLRLVSCEAPGLDSRELCCGTHAPSAGLLREFCVTAVRGAGSNAPTVHALAGDAALQAHELFCHTEYLCEVAQLTEAGRVRREAGEARRRLAALCGAKPLARAAACLQRLQRLEAQPDTRTHTDTDTDTDTDAVLQRLAEAEVAEAMCEARREGRTFAVHFVRSSYLLSGEATAAALAAAPAAPALPALPALLLACSAGVHSANVVKVEYCVAGESDHVRAAGAGRDAGRHQVRAGERARPRPGPRPRPARPGPSAQLVSPQPALNCT
ncbi:Alanyl-tRNA synthetase, mitochondrial [Papilio machaon]|uniref:alanine--tRNA ligase n=1 Tax=Papilio machaon TaxID=76193 RepID=A0A194RHR8_PAPMA|nr:Alanyl-tRNA synthetase, mitochondrial [Papilio machaon]